MVNLRSPICTVVGHVDHGKSSLLDKIRGSTIVTGEAGGITQAIGASTVPIGVVNKICQNMKSLSCNISLPGLLFIDTPGHAAFTNLRKRGGNLADVAILVIDINDGFKPQTFESVEILKSYKTPFIVAANKIDNLPGWKKKSDVMIQNMNGQDQKTITEFETKLYTLVAEFNKMGFNADRFDRVSDFTKELSIVPCSAKTGEGIQELLMMVTGLAQKFLENKLELHDKDFAKGTIIEVKDEKGLGRTIDVILYDGILKKNDTLVIGSLDQPIVTKVRALLVPNDLAEIRDKKTKFKSVNQVIASTGVKISAPNLEEVYSGMPIVSTDNANLEDAKQEVMQGVDEVVFDTNDEGIVVKADSLGSLEAMISLLRAMDIVIKRASIGQITKRDIVEAESNLEKDELQSVILGFNVEPDKTLDLEKTKVKILTNQVIYRLIEQYQIWLTEKQKEIELRKLANLVEPCKVRLIPNYVFRQSNPAVMGVEIVMGTCKKGIALMNLDGKSITSVKDMQHEKKSVDKADKEMQVAMSLSGVTVGRQIKEGDVLYSDLPESHFQKFKELRDLLTPDQKELLREIANIKRKTNDVWGI